MMVVSVTLTGFLFLFVSLVAVQTIPEEMQVTRVAFVRLWASMGVVIAGVLMMIWG